MQGLQRRRLGVEALVSPAWPRLPRATLGRWGFAAAARPPRPSSSIGMARPGRCSKAPIPGARPTPAACPAWPRRPPPTPGRWATTSRTEMPRGRRWSSAGTARRGRSSRVRTPTPHKTTIASSTWPPPPPPTPGRWAAMAALADPPLVEQWNGKDVEDPAQFKFPGRRAFRRGCNLFQRRVGSGRLLQRHERPEPDSALLLIECELVSRRRYARTSRSGKASSP